MLTSITPHTHTHTSKHTQCSPQCQGPVYIINTTTELVVYWQHVCDCSLRKDDNWTWLLFWPLATEAGVQMVKVLNTPTHWHPLKWDFRPTAIPGSSHLIGMSQGFQAGENHSSLRGLEHKHSLTYGMCHGNFEMVKDMVWGWSEQPPSWLQAVSKTKY